MNKPFWKSRLGIELLLATVSSIAAAALLFAGLHTYAYDLLDRTIWTNEFVSRLEAACAARLQEFVTLNRLSTTDRAKLEEWVTQERDVYLSLYQGNRVLYNSIDQYTAFAQIEEPVELTGHAEDTYPSDNPDIAPIENVAVIYPIAFQDGAANAVLSCFFQSSFYSYADAAAAVLSFLFFVAILLLLIRRKTRYITMLENELKILEGGDLDYQITVRGKDELASLASGIESMRRAILERQEQEEQAQTANRELITAMSHDLRTPLTSLIGYLDIIALKKYQTEEQLQQYLNVGREKAYQIKSMSDALFEYFLVYGKTAEDLGLCQVDAAELLGQVVEESLFDLESEGFQIQREAGEIDCVLRVDVDLIRRVFGNIFSNILKYADRAQPVKSVCRMNGDRLRVAFLNSPDERSQKAESTGIGLKTCEKIIDRHGGTFCCGLKDGLFTVEIELPARARQEPL